MIGRARSAPAVVARSTFARSSRTRSARQSGGGSASLLGRSRRLRGAARRRPASNCTHPFGGSADRPPTACPSLAGFGATMLPAASRRAGGTGTGTGCSRAGGVFSRSRRRPPRAAGGILSGAHGSSRARAHGPTKPRGCDGSPRRARASRPGRRRGRCAKRTRASSRAGRGAPALGCGAATSRRRRRMQAVTCTCAPCTPSPGAKGPRFARQSSKSPSTQRAGAASTRCTPRSWFSRSIGGSLHADSGRGSRTRRPTKRRSSPNRMTWPRCRACMSSSAPFAARPASRPARRQPRRSSP